jgi:hypothetical protein
MHNGLRSALVALLVMAGTPAIAAAQRHAGRTPHASRARAVRLERAPDSTVVTESEGDVALAPDTLPRLHSRTDSLVSARTLRAAIHDRALHLVVSIDQHLLWVIEGSDTLHTAAVNVGMGRLLEYGGRRWTFATPRGVRTIIAKSKAPKWRPPDWAYAEVAREYHLRLAHLPAKGAVTLKDGRKLVVRDSVAGLLLPDGFAPLPVDEHIVFDSTLYVPPLGTANRVIDGELGNFRLDMGNGYLLHGTASGTARRAATTHGCVRLSDDDLQWLYDFVPIGTKVYIY